MISELGHLSLVLALMMAILLALYPLMGVQTNNGRLMSAARPLSLGMFLFTGLAFASLTWSFLQNDFSVAYVAHHSNSQLPWFYRLSAVWGGHEGSFLLWMLIYAGWAAAVGLFSRSIPLPMVARVQSILGMIAIGFYLFVLLASNPFELLIPFYPVDGRDLNPLLQDFGMIIHPPMLYMGYVGFSVAFAFAIAALWAGELDSTWARWARPWTLAAWCFLTLGIALGSWWAYYELGWGGWWFWDPVENASFMPWLVGTGLIHSLAVTEKRKAFKSWTLFLALAAFSLSLLGTFLVRSGILVSVHAFATDPSRGLFILVLMLLVIGSSLLFYMLRAPDLKSYGRYDRVSREVMLIGNNILLCAATVVVLLGTLFPLVHKELGLGSISIGSPFFNQMFSWLILPFVLLMAIGPLSRWKRQPLEHLLGQLAKALVIAGIAAILINLPFGDMRALAWFGAMLSLVIGVSTIQELQMRLNRKGWSLGALRALGLSHWGMVLGHVGFAVTLMGIALTANYSTELDVRMGEGDRVTLAGYEFEFKGVSPVQGPNYNGHSGTVVAYRNGDYVATLMAEKRFYPVQQTGMTEAAIDAGFTRDLFVALGEPLNNGDWALRLYVKPFVRWLWLGAILMALGGLCSICDKRYRMGRAVKPAADFAANGENDNARSKEAMA